MHNELWRCKQINIGYKKWWDKECKRKKRRVSGCLKRWKKGIEGKERYLAERKGFKKLC